MLLAIALTTAFALQPAPGAPARVHICARRVVGLRMADVDGEDSLPDSFDWDAGLLKLPQLTTPQRASYDAWREKRKSQAGAQMGIAPEREPEAKLPLGMDPKESVDGLLADLSGLTEPADEQQQTAEAEAAFDGDDDGVGSALDDLLKK